MSDPFRAKRLTYDQRVSDGIDRLTNRKFKLEAAGRKLIEAIETEPELDAYSATLDGAIENLRKLLGDR